MRKSVSSPRPACHPDSTASTAAASILDKCPDIAILITGGHWLGQNRAMGGMHGEMGR